ncbi:hypothetical protein KDA_39600 [Dictyobacter alpinus]|uniref:Uncharacterized protein n=1 Tax=Dictyobacter alpinus TaxID=2014873 RepID=A0A402BAZ2_9CHLR|nr:hypothetical protein [Dictyobacter alpinus]GCE28476.1 hypothetical protein KDA_39600 [Dictyobacter alpinus]
MGVSYNAFPAEMCNDPKGRLWLWECEGIKIPEDIGPSRNPTSDEILLVLGQFTEYIINQFQGREQWDIEIIEKAHPQAYAQAILWITHEVRGEPIMADQPCDLYFYRGEPHLMVRIVQSIAAICGPFILFCHSGGAILIMPERTIAGPNW